MQQLHQQLPNTFQMVVNEMGICYGTKINKKFAYRSIDVSTVSIGPRIADYSSNVTIVRVNVQN